MFKRILLPVDLEDPNAHKKALNSAIEMAKSFGGELHVLSVVPTYGSSLVGSFFPDGFEREAQNAAGEKLKSLVASEIPTELSPEPHVAVGSIYEKIISEAERLGCDVIIMGAHRPELSDYLLGPNAARVVRHAKQSVFVVRD